MQALHRGLTRTTHLVPMVGKHWGDIGFQRDDGFATDLRAAGMLGPLLALALLEEQRPLALKVFNLCREQGRSLATGAPPFMVIGINFAQFVKLELRAGRLDHLANRPAAAGGGVLRVVLDLYMAHWLEFCEWRMSEPTALDALHINMLRDGGRAYDGKRRDAATGRSKGSARRTAAARIAAFRRHVAGPAYAQQKGELTDLDDEAVAKTAAES
jgi:hypothetical protein